MEIIANEVMLNSHRLIGHFQGQLGQPVIILVGGLHGNEPSGVIALEKVIGRIQRENVPLQGTIYALRGNLRALDRNVRFVSEDLNRLWTDKRIAASREANRDNLVEEEIELLELLSGIESIIERSNGNVHLVDLHTSSSDSAPFVTTTNLERVSDYLDRLPIPVVADVPRYMPGTLFEYMESLGYTSLVFEGGRHDNPDSVTNHEMAIWTSLMASGVMSGQNLPLGIHPGETLAARVNGMPKRFSVIYRHPIVPEDQFKMKPGFRNFVPILEGEIVAFDRAGEIVAPYSGRIFLPLYQGLGDDGFFIVQAVEP